jgi:hypothetical protein
MGTQMTEVRGVGEEALVGLRQRHRHPGTPSRHRLPEKRGDAVSLADRRSWVAHQYQGVEERHAYTEAKGPFIWNVMAQADRWAQQTGWMPGSPDA